MYLFPLAVVIDYNKRGGLEKHPFIILQFLKPEVQNKSHWDKTRCV